MTKDLATKNDAALDVPVSTDSLDELTRQAEAMAAAHKLASVLCNTAMVPQVFRGKPDDGAAAILYGAELGLKPQQALQQVFVVHGQPAIYARTMVALLKAKGYKFRTLETGDELVTVEGHSPRGEVEQSTWTIDRAKKAGYTSNKKYSSDPQAMLYAKAAAEVCRKLAPDVLLGIQYSAEELELDYIDGEVVEPTRKPGKLDRAISPAKAKAKSAPAEPEKPAQSGRTPDTAKKAIRQAQTIDRVNEVAMKAQAEFDAETFAGIAQIADEQIANLEALAAGAGNE